MGYLPVVDLVKNGGLFSPRSAEKVVEKKPQSSAAKAQVVGWPPIRSFRKNTMAISPPKNDHNADAKCLFVSPLAIKAHGAAQEENSIDAESDIGDTVSSALLNRANGMLQKLEKETYGVGAKISYRGRVLELVGLNFYVQL
ncbi:hypothetical protein ACET3Z_032108 [Daucus carota]